MRIAKESVVCALGAIGLLMTATSTADGGACWVTFLGVAIVAAAAAVLVRDDVRRENAMRDADEVQHKVEELGKDIEDFNKRNNQYLNN